MNQNDRLEMDMHLLGLKVDQIMQALDLNPENVYPHGHYVVLDDLCIWYNLRRTYDTYLMCLNWYTHYRDALPGLKIEQREDLYSGEK